MAHRVLTAGIPWLFFAALSTIGIMAWASSIPRLALVECVALIATLGVICGLKELDVFTNLIRLCFWISTRAEVQADHEQTVHGPPGAQRWLKFSPWHRRARSDRAK